MVSDLAKGDIEDLQAQGLKPTLEDFDRLNCIALRLTDGAETTLVNFPRVGWAGDIPFFQPTCAALAWYLTYVDRTSFAISLKDACWFFALAHGRDVNVFENLIVPSKIEKIVNEWLSTLNVTIDEVARACRYATTGFDDAVAAKPPSKQKEDESKTEEDKRESSLNAISQRITLASADTGIEPDELLKETPSRLEGMIAEARELSKDNRFSGLDQNKLRADYDMTFREIRKRLIEERDK